jgi:hypothetical protein
MELDVKVEWRFSPCGIFNCTPDAEIRQERGGEYLRFGATKTPERIDSYAKEEK